MNEKKDQEIKYSHIAERCSSYIRQFWVGLMDGDGSLQVNHWRKQSLQYRLVIKLKNDPDKYNYTLLQIIRKSIGGDVRIVSSSRFVIWVENHKSKISQIVKIFDKYPPYTKRLYDQYLFYLESVKINNVDWYLENRDKKYQTKQYTIAMTNPDIAKRCYRFVTSVTGQTPLNTLLETPLEEKRWGRSEWSKSITPQSTQSAKSAQSGDTPDAKEHTEEQSFKGWLSGFIEAVGCFTLTSDSSKEDKKEKVCSFSISQKGDPFLLERINMFFGGQTKVRKVLLKKHIYIDQKKDQKDHFYILEIYKKTVLEKVLSHCTAHPLYGEKQKSFNLFKKTFI